MPGIRQHIKAALGRGATADEIMEVLELTATLGIHAMNIGVPILVEVLDEKGLRTGPAPLTDRQEEMKADFTKTRGYWHEFWDEMLELDPELFAAYTEFSSVPWRTGTLAPKVKEFVYIAFDTAATHLYVKGLKLHIENAIGYGATAAGDPRGDGDRVRARHPRGHDRRARSWRRSWPSATERRRVSDEPPILLSAVDDRVYKVTLNRPSATPSTARRAPRCSTRSRRAATRRASSS